jgi:hypothetical protein
VFREQQDEIEEEDFALGQRQHAVRLRAGSAAEALKRARRRVERAQQRQAQEA